MGTVPYVPLSHPFVERLIGTIRRELLDRTLFWTTADLETKLIDFLHYYNAHRTHAGLEGRLTRTGRGWFSTHRSRLLPMAKTLPRVVPDSNCRMNHEFAINRYSQSQTPLPSSHESCSLSCPASPGSRR